MHETIRVERDGHVATVVLDRPEVHNAFNATMRTELRELWRALRTDDEIRCVVLTGSGDKAFCTGIDRAEIDPSAGWDPLAYDDPGQDLGPKSNGLFTPVIAAVNGMACGGAFYLLGEVEFIIAADHATFFDPHVTYGMTAVYEPALLMRRMPFGEVARLALMGAHERISAASAQRMGLVSEVVSGLMLLETAKGLAEAIASQPTAAVRATVRALWAARELTPAQTAWLGPELLNTGVRAEDMTSGQETFTSGRRIEPRLR